MPKHWRSMRLVHAIVGLAAITGVLTPVVSGSSRECGGVKRIYYNNDLDKECVGVSDGSYHFNDPQHARSATDRKLMSDINALQNRIRLENAFVARQGRYVKLVLMMPLTVNRFQDADSALTHIRNSLEGAYTALNPFHPQPEQRQVTA